jgi:hypothetical protein
MMKMRKALLIALLLIFFLTGVHGITSVRGITDGILSSKPPLVKNGGRVDMVVLPPTFSKRATPGGSGAFHVAGSLTKVKEHSRYCCGSFVAGVVDGWSTLPSVIAVHALVVITFEVAYAALKDIEEENPGATKAFTSNLSKIIIRVRKLCSGVTTIQMNNVFVEELMFRGFLNWPLWMFGWLQNDYKLYLYKHHYSTYLKRYPRMKSNALMFRRMFMLCKRAFVLRLSMLNATLLWSRERVTKRI